MTKPRSSIPFLQYDFNSRLVKATRGLHAKLHVEDVFDDTDQLGMRRPAIACGEGYPDRAPTGFRAHEAWRSRDDGGC
jgi:hypothetical protein